VVLELESPEEDLEMKLGKGKVIRVKEIRRGLDRQEWFWIQVFIGHAGRVHSRVAEAGARTQQAGVGWCQGAWSMQARSSGRDSYRGNYNFQ
jgi:hypothetical protein